MVVVADVPDKVERWTAGRRVALVLSILKGEISVQEAARKHALRVAEIEDWKDKFLSGANNALRSRPRNEEQLKDEEIRILKQKVGELVLQVDVLEFAAANQRPYGPRDVRRLTESFPGLSLRKACRLLKVARSSMEERETSARSLSSTKCS
jgi:transposase-like protein